MNKALEKRAAWAKRLAIAVRPIKWDQEGKPVKWTVPAMSGTTGMEYHHVDRINGHFRCYKMTPLNPSGLTCMGNRVAKAGTCRHVMTVAAHELEKQGRTITFRHEEADTDHLHRAGFHLVGEAGSLYVTHRKRG